MDGANAMVSAPPLRSFDQAIRADEHRLRNGDSELSRGLQVDDELELRRLLDRQLSGLCALEDPVDVARGSARELAPIVDCTDGA